MPDMPSYLRDGATRVSRVGAICFALLCATAAAATLAQAGLNTGFDIWDGFAVALIALTTAWLAWGAGQAFLGVPSFDPLPDMDLSNADFPPTAILVPICNENPTEVCARTMAMRQSMQAANVPVDFAILSDTFDPDALIAERAALAPLEQLLRSVWKSTSAEAVTRTTSRRWRGAPEI